MKRITILFLLVTVMMGAVSFTEAAVTKPESGKMYNIVHSRTGFYLTATVESQGAYISPASGNVNQRFYIIEQEDGVYKMKLKLIYIGINVMPGIQDGVQTLRNKVTVLYLNCR